MKLVRPRFFLESLEDRSLPTSFGIPWPDASHLTISFVPDGTQTPNGPSTLFQTMNAMAPTAVWETQILRAYQAWLSTTNINVAVVSDDGEPLGATGAAQGDSRFGDIRVAAAPLGSDILATTTPFSWTGTTLSGDLIFNSSELFVNNPAAITGYDFYSVAIHEAGHSIGFDVSTATDSVMLRDYEVHTALGASDIGTVQSMYGVRTPDAYDLAAGVGGNNSMSTATQMPQAPGSTELLANADLSSPSDVDYYKFTISTVNALIPVAVRLKASGLSLLNARLTIYNSSGAVVATTSSTDPRSNDLALQFTSSLLGGTYYAKVDSTDPTFNVGSYELAVDRGLLSVMSPLTTNVVSILDNHTNDLISDATNLLSQNSNGQDGRFDYYYNGVIEDSTDKDTFRVQSHAASAAGPQNMNVMVWALGSNTLNPLISVFDASGNPVAFQVLSNDTGLMSTRVANVASSASYYVQVAARVPGSGPTSTGQYAIAVDFNTLAAPSYDATSTDTLNSGSTNTISMTIGTSGLFQFGFSSAAISSGSGTATMSVFNAAGTLVFTMNAVAGQLMLTSTTYLAAGTYTVQFSSRSSSVPLAYSMSLLDLSGPMGTYKPGTTSTAPRRSRRRKQVLQM